MPWLWSNQYSLKLQTAGLTIGYDREEFRGEPAERAFTLVYLKNDRVVVLDCVNRTHDYVHGRPLVIAGVRVDPAVLADPTIELKVFAAR